MSKKSIISGLSLLCLVILALKAYSLFVPAGNEGKDMDSSVEARDQKHYSVPLDGTIITTSLSNDEREVPTNRAADYMKLFALSSDSELSFRSRLKAVDAIDYLLNSDDRKLYLTFLESEEGLQQLSDSQNHELKNDIARSLREQDDPEEELTQSWLRIYKNPLQNVVMHEYAIQHLSLLYQNSKYQEAIDDVFAHALEVKKTTQAGTALLALQRLNREGALKPSAKELLVTSSLSMSADSEADTVDRICAIQVIGQLGLVEGAETLQSVLRNTSSTFALRLAAIGSLGELQQPESRAVLELQLSDDNQTLRKAAQAALNQLNRS